MTANPRWLKRKDAVRGLIPHNLKSLLISMLVSRPVAKILRALFNNKIPHKRGVRINVNSPLILDRNVGSIFFGIYERAEIDQVEAYMDRSLPVIELGASIGVNTLQILKLNSNQVVAVEADPKIFPILQQNLLDNFAAQHACTPINCAIDYSGAETIRFASSENTLSGQVGASSASDTVQEVPAVTLGDLVERYQFEQYNLVIDIEGSEAGLIVEERAALAKCFRIMAEIDGGMHNDTHYSIMSLVEQLQSYGFKLLHLHGNRASFENTIQQ